MLWGTNYTSTAIQDCRSILKATSFPTNETSCFIHEKSHKLSGGVTIAGTTGLSNRWGKAGAVALFLCAGSPEVASATVSFGREIKPILTEKCYQCHGPDAEARKADLRLDQKEGAYAKAKSGNHAIVPGNAEASTLISRIFSKDEKKVMPTLKTGKTLSAEEKEKLRQWIDEGAEWEKHWSLRKLARPPVPKVTNPTGKPNDAFIRSNLEKLDLQPSPQADKLTLVRRLYYDLTGLPPTPEEANAFVNDESPDAYVKLIDYLLDSPRYGERWGRHWLDVVKYADTCGYDKDKLRPNAWPYRDYVIRSFNEDKPFARFVEEQIAGDALFPDDPDGILGLGFVAAGPWDFIGHVEVPESKLDGQVARHLDRDEMVTNTLNTFCGATVQCARCHDHKFDPFTQEHYYGLQSVFAAVDRANRPYDQNPQTQKRKKELEAGLATLRKEKAGIEEAMKKEGGPELAKLNERIKALNSKLKPPAKRPEFGYHSKIEKSPDKAKWAQVDLGERVDIKKVILSPCHDDHNNIGAGFGFPVRFQVIASNRENFSRAQVLADESKKDFINPGLIPVEYAVQSSARYLRIAATKLALRSNDYIFALAELQVLDGDGKNRALKAKVSSLDSIEAPIRWRRSNLTDGIWASSAGKEASREIANLNKEKADLVAKFQTPKRKTRIGELDKAIKQANAELAKTSKGRMIYAVATDFKAQGQFKPTKGKLRPIHVLHRGNLKEKREVARPGALPLFPDGKFVFDLAANHAEHARRAALAQWIVRPNHPLTWRVIANRIWQWHFGDGIVPTPNDLGGMGQPPSMPVLLDWLACEFQDNGGSFKKIHKLILTSAAWRQSSVANDKALAVDGGNRFLWRMNRRRLEAEELRDAILTVSGKLNLEMGGPGYYLFALEKTAHSPHYEYHKFNPEEPKSHRRSVYRFIVRSQPDPYMTTLDCADSSQSTPKREETLTALQALSLLNNKFNLAMASHFAKRLEDEGGELSDQVERAFRLVTHRKPTAEEREALETYARKHGLSNLCRTLFNLSEFTYLD